jgi:predicted HD superfamily hydrolase involved in NAD metabolism
MPAGTGSADHVRRGSVGELERAERLIEARLSRSLVEHSRRVAATAASLARRWGGDEALAGDAAVAGTLHDYCRELSPEETLAEARRLGVSIGPLEERRPVQLLHAPLAAAEVAAFGFADRVLRAIARHTVGAPGMTLLEDSVYVADAIEPGRTFAGVDALRAAASGSPDEAVAACVREGLASLIAQQKPLHPSSVALYNELHG